LGSGENSALKYQNMQDGEIVKQELHIYKVMRK